MTDPITRLLSRARHARKHLRPRDVVSCTAAELVAMLEILELVHDDLGLAIEDLDQAASTPPDQSGTRLRAHDRWLAELDDMGLSARYDPERDVITIDEPRAYICMDTRLWEVERIGGNVDGCSFAALVAYLKECQP